MSNRAKRRSRRGLVQPAGAQHKLGLRKRTLESGHMFVEMAAPAPPRATLGEKARRRKIGKAQRLARARQRR